ncbi:hypothetical protein LIA77_03441 [Sarocladium implicatum]|nr:hypothetical protein LIA77_03441 [Sarocladium implicatum]
MRIRLRHRDYTSHEVLSLTREAGKPCWARGVLPSAAVLACSDAGSRLQAMMRRTEYSTKPASPSPSASRCVASLHPRPLSRRPPHPWHELPQERGPQGNLAAMTW